MRLMSNLRATFAGILLLVSALSALAADFPTRQIEIYTPFPGYNDAMARLIAKKMSEELGQPIVVENLPGAGGAIAAAKVRQAPADGHTLLFGANGMFTINPLINKSLGYKTADFTPVSLGYSDPMLLLVNKDMPVNSVKELIDYAKAHPGAVTFGSSGVGTITHLAGELLKSMSSTNMVHVPYKGTSQALTDLVGGRISALFFPPQDAMQYIQTGKVKVLAISTMERAHSLPDVPTLNESGLAGYDLVVWYGFFVPAKTPKNVVDKLQRSIASAVNNLDLPSRDLLPGGNTPEQFDDEIKSDTQKLTKIVSDLGLLEK
jgi:tripartite-type tricarboxylate transporter receptor subunit TctC